MVLPITFPYAIALNMGCLRLAYDVNANITSYCDGHHFVDLYFHDYPLTKK